MELVRASVHLGRSTKRALGQEEGHAGLAVLSVVRRGKLVEVAGRRKHVVALAVVASEALLAFELTLVDRKDRWVVLAWVVDVVNVTQRRVRVEQMVRASCEGEPLGVGLDLLHEHTHVCPGLLDRVGHAAGGSHGSG